MREHHVVRRILVAVMILGAGTAALASSAQAGKKKQAKPVKVAVANVVTKNQQQLLSQKRLVVRVRSTGRTAARISVVSAGRRNLFRATTVRFRKRGVKRVRLQLTGAGRNRLGQCGGKTLRVQASYRRKVGKRVRKARATRQKRLSKWAANPRCAEPESFVTVPLGDNPERCDFLDQTVCLHPFPNDIYTKPDSSTPTGKRLDLHPLSTPVNTGSLDPEKETNISVTDINRGDGFSPGNKIIIKIPGLDTPQAIANNDFVSLENLHAYTDPSQRVLLIDAETGQRHPIWAEIDSNPTAVDPSDSGPGGINQNPSNTDPVNLIVRPAKNLDWGKRYIVAFRDLKDAAGNAIEAPLGFEVYRDGLKTQQPIVEARRAHMNEVINTVVSKAGVDRSSLYMAWDFTVASQKSVAGRALQIRDDAFARLGDNNRANRMIEGSSPEVQVTYTCDRYENPNPNAPVSDECKNGPNPPSGLDSRPDVPGSGLIRIIDGKIKNVPCYLNIDGCPAGATFDFKPDGSIDFKQHYKVDVPFRCFIPTEIQPGGKDTAVLPGQAGIYGHGLLGDLNQITSPGPVNVAREGGSVWCGANWDGFSTADLLSVFEALNDMSSFPKMADRMLQGFVNFMMIQRAMIHEEGFAAQPAFQLDPDGAGGSDPVSVIDVSNFPNTRGIYMGISQGGIMGGALMALTPDSDYGVLGVPGMNYSTLLRRSVDSDMYFKTGGIGLYSNYPDERERPLLLSLVQLLWDRGEANGYAANMTSSPLPDTPPHQVMLRVAYGDHQVANYTAEVEARTIGAAVHEPALNSGRHWDVNPYMGMEKVTAFPRAGESWLVYYDSGPVDFVGNLGIGSGKPPIENVPPRSEWGYGRDAHEDPRRSPDGIKQASRFLLDGTMLSCEVTTPLPAGDAHCYANDYLGSAP